MSDKLAKRQRNNIEIGFLCPFDKSMLNCTFNEMAAEGSKRGCPHREEFACTSIEAQLDALKGYIKQLTGRRPT